MKEDGAGWRWLHGLVIPVRINIKEKADASVHIFYKKYCSKKFAMFMGKHLLRSFFIRTYKNRARTDLKLYYKDTMELFLFLQVCEIFIAVFSRTV